MQHGLVKYIDDNNDTNKVKINIPFSSWMRMTKYLEESETDSMAIPGY